MTDDQPSILDPTGPPSVLALHGLGGGRFELAPLIDALEAKGSSVLAPVLPGHEVTAPVMPASSWEDWAATALSNFDELAALGRPVVTVGFSTGATLALHLATCRPVARLVLLAPFLAIRFTGLIPMGPAVYLRTIARFLPDLPRRSPPARDPEARRALHSVTRFRTFSLRATVSALDLIEHVKPLVPTIRTPTYILQGRLDTVVEPRGAEWLLRNLGSTEKFLLWLDRSDHLLLLDREREQVIAASVALALGGRAV
jgi:carboxylesterase